MNRSSNALALFIALSLAACAADAPDGPTQSGDNAQEQIASSLSKMDPQETTPDEPQCPKCAPQAPVPRALKLPDGSTYELSADSMQLSGPDETREGSVSWDGESWTSLGLADLEKTGLLAKNNDRDTSCLTWFEKWIERFGIYCSCHPGYVICIGPAILE